MKKEKEYMGKLKLYADENVSYGVVSVLRSKGVNISHAIDVNLINRDDKDHFQYAKKTNSWLLTSDRDFLNHNDFPFEQIKGIVIIPDIGKNYLLAGKIMAWLKHELVPSGKGINNCKVEFRENNVIFHFRREGKIYTQKIECR